MQHLDAMQGVGGLGKKMNMQRFYELLAGAVLVLETVPEDVRAMREEVCLTCDKRSGEENRCKVCKCFLAVKQTSKENRNPLKFRNEITHCPLGLWNDKDTANMYREVDGLPPLT